MYYHDHQFVREGVSASLLLCHLVSSNNQAAPLLAALRVFVVWIIDVDIWTCPHQ